jgi:hypothetical protein
MRFRELRPRLWHWTAPHPDWTPEQGGPEGWEQDVGCYAYVPPDGGTLVLLDPLAPEWDTLDRDVERHGPPHVLITCRWHARSADEILGRYEGARTWVFAPAVEETSKAMRVTDGFEFGDELPGDVEAHLTFAEIGEVAYRIPEYRAIVTGDALARAPGADVRVWWADQERLRAVGEAGVEMLLLTHGEPVLEGGGDALARALG